MRRNIVISARRPFLVLNIRHKYRRIANIIRVYAYNRRGRTINTGRAQVGDLSGHVSQFAIRSQTPITAETLARPSFRFFSRAPRFPRHNCAAGT